MISEEVLSPLKLALGLAKLGPSDPLRQIAQRVLDDYDPTGCEGCGSIPAETLAAIKQVLAR